MKPDLPLNRSTAAKSQASGILAQPAAPSKQSRQSSVRTAPEAQYSSSIALKVERHGRWALLSQTQTQLSKLQGSERAIVHSYRELLQLVRQLERTGVDGNQLAARVADLKQQLTRDGNLDGDLQLRHENSPARYVLDRVDLISPRDQSESLAIQLPNGRNINLRLEAGTAPSDQLRQLNDALRPVELKADVNEQAQLRLSGSRELLSSPWVFRGQGIRVPAGNPVSIQLGQEPDQLSRLQSGLDRGELSTEKQRLRGLLETLEQQRRSLENQRQQLLRHIAQLHTSQSRTAEQQTELSSAVKNTLQAGDFTLQLNTLMAQANVSRFSVVALLSR